MADFESDAIKPAGAATALLLWMDNAPDGGPPEELAHALVASLQTKGVIAFR